MVKRAADVSADERDPLVPERKEMFHRQRRTPPVVDKDRRMVCPLYLIIDEDDGETEGIDVRDQLLVHLPGDDDSVDVPFEEKPRHIFVRIELVPHRRQEDIIVVVAGLKLRPQEYPCVEGLGLGEVFFGEYEPDIPACFGGKPARRARGVICELTDDLLHRLAGPGTNVSPVVDHK